MPPEVIFATVVQLTGFSPDIRVWFPKKDIPISISYFSGKMGRTLGAAGMNGTSVRPRVPGFYWFEGRLAGKGRNREETLATVVRVGMVGERVVVFFPRGEGPVLISPCDGQWDGPLEVPR